VCVVCVDEWEWEMRALYNLGRNEGFLKAIRCY
jgi:hypothetical protein